VLDDGDGLARHGHEQAQEGSETLASLGRARPDSDEFDELVEKLVLQLHKHTAFCDRVFLRLRPAVSPEELARLGEQVRRVEGRGGGATSSSSS
jgi:hypothetical protein